MGKEKNINARLTIENCALYSSVNLVFVERIILNFIILFLLAVSLQVVNIWSQTSTTHFIIANIFGYNITDSDIKSLEGTHWLIDQVIFSKV